MPVSISTYGRHMADPGGVRGGDKGGEGGCEWVLGVGYEGWVVERGN